VQTGACDASGFCLLRTWCPLEAPHAPSAGSALTGRGSSSNTTSSNATSTLSLAGVSDLQVLLFIAVRWNKFLSSDGKTEAWESPSGRGAAGSMFYTVGELLSWAGTTYDDVAATGADVTLNFRFDCDWDLAQAKTACRPDLLTARVDTRGLSRAVALPVVAAAGGGGGAPGYSARTLQRTTGLYFRLQFSGQARQFDFDSTVTTIGALLYFLSLVGAVTDWLAPWLLPRRHRAAVDAATVEVVQLPPLDDASAAQQQQQPRESELLRRRGAAVVAEEEGGLDAAPANGGTLT
jgi:hypothetical protein